MKPSILTSFSLLEKVQNFKWAKNIHSLKEKEQVVAQIGSLRVKYYSSATGTDSVFIIPSFINRHYVLDLLPEKSLIQFFMSQCVNVYLLDWGIPDDEEKHLSFERFLELHFNYLYHEVLSFAKSNKIHLIGHCLGGTLATLWSLIYPETVQSLTLLTAPVDFHQGGTFMKWAHTKEFNAEKFVEARGEAPWMWMQLGFLGVKPVQSILKYKKVFEKRNDSRFMENFLALELWSFDNVSMRSEFFINLIRDFYQNNCLVDSGFKFLKNKYYLKDLKVPVSVLNAVDDHIVPLGSTLHNHHIERGQLINQWNMRGGHIGALMSYNTQTKCWPEIVQWIKEMQNVA